MTRKRNIAMYAVTLVLAFVVGTLVGPHCHEPREELPPPEPARVECDPIREVIYECPPEPTPVAKQTTAKPGAKVARRKSLPSAAPPPTPKQRKRLLAWVRDQSGDLETCRPSAKDTYRMSATLELDDTGTVEKVGINAQTSEVPADVRACLRGRMQRWTPPTDLVGGQSKLVFGLTL